MSRYYPRPIRIEGDVAYIPLTKGYVAVIDTVDVPLVDGVCWTAAEDGNTVYAYRRTKETGLVKLHRLIMDAAPLVLVDHKDGDGLNNRRGNLRIASNSQNGANMRLLKRNTSGLKGAVWKNNGWEAQIRFHGRSVYLGRFKTCENAHAAYMKASIALHGDFARAA